MSELPSNVKTDVPYTDNHKTKLEWALWNVHTFGLPIFPVFELNPDGTCSCGKPALPADPDARKPGVDYCKSPGKHPATHGDWKEAATTDESKIRAWWKANPNRNIGQRPTNIVIDLDRKPEKRVKDSKGKVHTVPAKDGVAEFAKLMGPDAMNQVTAIKTTSGGLHLHFATGGKHYKNETDHPARGVDVRGPDGYVLAAGSTLYREVDGKMNELRYEPVRIMPPQPLSSVIAARLEESKQRESNDREAIGNLDTEARIMAFANWLKEYEPGVEGEAGDSHTYAAFAMAAECGVSEERAMDIVSEWVIIPHTDGTFASWNDSCVPPWAWDELSVKAGNAFKYGQDAPGSRDLMEIFDVLDGNNIGDTLTDAEFAALQIRMESAVASKVQEKESAAKEDSSWEDAIRNAFKPYRAQDPKTIPPRRFIYGTSYFRDELVVTVAAGGVGKTSLVFLESYDMTTGALNLETLHKGPVRVAFGSFEDTQMELERKAEAIRQHYNGGTDVWADRLTLVSFKSLGLKLTERDDAGNIVISERAFTLLESVIHENRLDVLHIDPWVNCHGYTESANTEIGNLALRLANLAESCRCCIHVVHHSRKGTRGGPEELTADDSRGASALVNKARLVRVVNPMTKDESRSHGIAIGDRWRYFRLDDAKANYGEMRIGGNWFRKRGVSLGNGEDPSRLDPGELAYQADNIGVVERVDLTPKTDGLTPAMVTAIRTTVEIMDIRHDVRAKVGSRIHDVIAREAGLDWSQDSDRLVIKAMLTRLIATGVLAVESREDGHRENREFVTTGPATHLPEHAPEALEGENDFDFGDGSTVPTVPTAMVQYKPSRRVLN